MVTASEWEERQHWAGQTDDLLWGLWSMISELVEKYSAWPLILKNSLAIKVDPESLRWGIPSLRALGQARDRVFSAFL